MSQGRRVSSDACSNQEEYRLGLHSYARTLSYDPSYLLLYLHTSVTRSWRTQIKTKRMHLVKHSASGPGSILSDNPLEPAESTRFVTTGIIFRPIFASTKS